MKDWIKENSKWLYPTITFIGGLLLGFYLAILRYESKIETIQHDIQNINDNVHDINVLIQNKLLTKPIE